MTFSFLDENKDGFITLDELMHTLGGKNHVENGFKLLGESRTFE